MIANLPLAGVVRHVELQRLSSRLGGLFGLYLKGEENGWEKTPKIRTTALHFAQDPVYDMVEEDFPIPRTDYRKLYFQPDEKLGLGAPAEVSSVSYDSEKYLDHAGFTYTFSEKTRLMGIPKAFVYVSCADFHDLAIYILVRKLDAQGKPLLSLNIPWSYIASQGASPDNIDEIPSSHKNNLLFHVGSQGILRASRGAIDWSKSIHENLLFHPHDRDEFVTPGEIVKLEICIWAMGVEYEASESVRVEVHGNSPALRGEFKEDNEFASLASHGRYHVYIGGEHASHIILPFV